MDRIIYFNYFFGSIDELKSGNFEDMQLMDSLKDVEIAEALNQAIGPSKIILIPKFVGIYQESRLKADNVKEENYIEDFQRTIEDIEEEINNYYEEIGYEDIHPDLIHICFDPNIYDEGIVRSLIGEDSKRLGFSSYKTCPDFSQKNTTVEETCLEKIYGLEGNLKEKNKIEKITKTINEAYENVRKQLTLYGLTRNEKEFLEISARMKTKTDNMNIKNSKIIDKIVYED